MGLTIISETVSEMCKVAHSFSDGEKEYKVILIYVQQVLNKNVQML